MAEDLGVAQLKLEVDPSGLSDGLEAARRQIEGFNANIQVGIRPISAATANGLFSAITAAATNAGNLAGDRFFAGLQNAINQRPLRLPDIQLPDLDFGSIEEALNFNPANSIAALEQYRRALTELRDTSDFTEATTQQLTDRIGALASALNRIRQTTAQATQQQRDFNAALDGQVLNRLNGELRQFAAGLRQQAASLRENTSLLQSFRQNAESTAKSLAGLAAKGIGETLKVPIFGLPKEVTSTFDKARKQIEELQRQSETASGKVARLSEGLAVLGAGGFAGKGIVDTLGGVGSEAEVLTGALASVRDALASLPGPLKGLGGIDDLFNNGAQSVANWAASILQVQGDLSTLLGPLDAVTNAISAIGPEAAVVGGALAFTFAGFQDLIASRFKPGVDGARKALQGITDQTQELLEALARVGNTDFKNLAQSTASLSDLQAAKRDALQRQAGSPAGSPENIQATEELLAVDRLITEQLKRQAQIVQNLKFTEAERLEIATKLLSATKPSRLALPSTELLQQRVQSEPRPRQIRRLDDIGINDVSFEGVFDAALKDAREFTASLQSGGSAAESLRTALNQPVAGIDNTNADLLVLLNLLTSSVEQARELGAIDVNLKRFQREGNERQDLARLRGFDDNLKRFADEGKKNLPTPEAQAIARVLKEISQIDASKPFDDLAASARDAKQAVSSLTTPTISPNDLELARRDALRRQAAAPVGSTANVKATQDLARIEALITREKQRQEQLNKQLGISAQGQVKAANDKLKALSAETKASRAAADQRGKKAKDAVGSAIIGGAFPALFGQGIGASVGGGLGGLAGGAIGGQFGFGLSLVGTALGAQVDAAVAKLGVLGSALKDPITNFQELAQAGLISSAALERNIAALIANGKEAEAAALIQLDAARQFGDTSDIEALSSANAELSRSFSQLSVQLVKVAAGPLSNFISTLAASFKVFSEKGLVEERFKQAGINDNERKTILAQARNNTAADREDLSQGQGFLITLTEINRLLDERIGKTKEVAQAESASAKAIERSTKLRSNSFRAIDTQVFGNKALTLELEKQSVELERQQQIAAKRKGIQPEERKAIDEKASLETYRINQDIAKLDRERYANNIVSANKLRDIQAEIAIQSAKPGLSSIGEGALQALRQLEQARRNVEEAQAKAAVTPGNQGLAAESIIASKQLELAGISVRNSLREAFQNGKQAVQDLSRALQDSQLRLSEQRGGTGGVNSFLSGQALLNRQTAEFQRLLPQFTAVREQLARQQSDPFVASGIRNTNFSGATADVNKSLIEFIRSAREEMRVVQDQKVIETQLRVAQSNQALIQSLTTSGEQTNTLTANVNLLSEAVAALTGKDWAVSVNVNTDNGAATVQTIQGL